MPPHFVLPLPVPAVGREPAPHRPRVARRTVLATVVLTGLFAFQPLAAQDSSRGQTPEQGRPGEQDTTDQPPPTLLVIPPASGHRPAETPTFKKRDQISPEEGSRGRHRRFEGEQQLLDGYRGVLELVAADQGDDALTALFEFETGAMEGREPKEVQRLYDAEVEVVKWVGVKDLEALVPMLALHHDAYRMYVDRGQPLLAGHSSRLAASLADLYAREGGSEGSRVLGARALASLGIYSQLVGVKLQGLGLMLHALDFDPNDAAALLGIATVHERSGNYHRAAERLLELLKVDPSNREGRLRMAVNLERLGSARDAQRLLESLLAEGKDDWETVVAYEELGTMHRKAGRTKQAESVLRKGLERYPDSECLRTQLAFVLDSEKDPKQSLSVIHGLADGAGQRSPSPRRRYGMGPQETYDRALAALHENAATRVSRLARLLGEVGRDRPAAAGAAR